MSVQQQGKKWCWTLNHYTEDDVGYIPGWVESDHAIATYIVFQKEVCPTTGTPHLQGYAQFKKNMRLSALKKLHRRVHWERQSPHATNDQAAAYCKKDDSRLAGSVPCEHGTFTGKAGQRNDLLAVKDALDSGASYASIAEDYFGSWCRNNRAFKEYMVLKRQNARNWPTLTTVYWGPPGTGKSRRALEEGGLDAFWLPRPQGGTVWFDGYDGQETVVMDEFDGSWMKRDLMQRICDRYPLLVQVKGGTVPFTAKRVIITSNKEPKDWWQMGLGPMERRLEGDLGKIVYMGPDQHYIPSGELAASAERAANPFGLVSINIPGSGAGVQAEAEHSGDTEPYQVMTPPYAYDALAGQYWCDEQDLAFDDHHLAAMQEELREFSILCCADCGSENHNGCGGGSAGQENVPLVD